MLSGFDGILIPGGFGERGVEGKVQAIRFARERGIPFFGICLGMQCAVIEYARNVCGLEKAHSSEFDKDTPHPVICLLDEQQNVTQMGGTMRLGGQVCQNETLEVGWHIMQQTQASRTQPWLADLPERFEVFQWHAHIYSKPPGAVVLAGNDCFSQQAFSLGNILGMQFHLEMTPELVEFLIDRFSSDIAEESVCVQQAAAIRANMDERMRCLHDTADAVYGRWLACVYGY